MKVYINRINKVNHNDILLFKFKGDPIVVASTIWKELLEPRYMLETDSFLRAWRFYTQSNTDIVRDNKHFISDELIRVLNEFDAVKFEDFLEKVWFQYKFIIRII